MKTECDEATHLLAEEGYRALSADVKAIEDAFWPLILETLPPWDDEELGKSELPAFPPDGT